MKIVKNISFMLLVISSINVSAQPGAVLNVTRVSGPAPLAVMFDATDTTHSGSNIDTFRELGYHFDFNDASSGTWEHSGLSKNIETGAPLAVHIFNTPGVYQVGVRAQDAQGLWSDAYQTITVTDPNEVYKGTLTVVLSRGSDFSAAPAGAEQLGNLTAWPAWESNKRYLLKAGDDFTSFGQLWIKDRSNFQIASFGNGAKPLVSNVSVDMDVNNAATPPKNGLVQGLDVDSIIQYKMFNDLLVYQNDVIGDGARIAFAAANSWHAVNGRGSSAPEDWKHPGSIFVVENHVNMQGYPHGHLNAISGMGHHIAILGNKSEQAKEHTTRIFGAYKAVVGHNALSGPTSDRLRTDLKFHAIGIEPWPADHAVLKPGTVDLALSNSRYARMHNNTIGRPDGPHPWHVGFGPQDSGSSNTVEGIRDVISENNHFIDGLWDNGIESGLYLMGHSHTTRGNIMPSVWTTPVRPISYPSIYSDYSPLYTPFWHGPYYVNVPVPTTSAPSSVPSAGEIRFQSNNAEIAENGNQLQVTVIRTGGTNGAASVTYSTSDGTAVAGSDYVAVNANLTFLNGESSKTITLDIVNDTIAEATENFTLTLSNAISATLGSARAMDISIHDDDGTTPPPPLGEIAFLLNSAEIAENGNQLQVTVIRTGGTIGAASVTYSTSDGTAVAGSDYVAVNANLTFLNGESTKTIPLDIVNDTIAEATENFTLTLSNAISATLGSIRAMDISIRDDDGTSPPPGPNPVNLAPSSSVTASSEVLPALNAIDNDLSNRWSSEVGNVGWIALDLGSIHYVAYIKIHWDTASAASYELQGSLDGVNWEHIKRVSGGLLGPRADARTIKKNYRHIRVYATERSTGNNAGYSINELELFGNK